MKRFTPIIYAYLEQEETAGRISCAAHTVRGVCPLHGHDFYELELILDGRGRQWLNSACVPLERGSLYLCTPEDVHRVEPETPLQVISVHFLPETARQFGLETARARAGKLSGEAYGALAPLAAAAAKAGGAYAELQYQGVTALLLERLLGEGREYAAAPSGRRMQQALRFIRENHANPALRLRDAADACGLSACHFSATFSAAVGCGFSEYLTSYRLYCACALLAETENSVSEVAYETGFGSLSHFFRVFHQAYGCTPRDYRRQIQTAQSAEKL